MVMTCTWKAKHIYPLMIPHCSNVNVDRYNVVSPFTIPFNKKYINQAIFINKLELSSVDSYRF